jgi:hypothetical protein
MKLVHALAPALLLFSGCSRTQQVARGPIDVRAVPTEVRFDHLVVAHGSKREVCFEFERPGDSRLASKIRVTLVTAAGSKEPLSGKLDRRGEALVALVGSVAAPAGASPEFTTLEYRGVELSCGEPVRLRGLRWASGE